MPSRKSVTILLLAGLAAGLASGADDVPKAKEARIRRPVALAVSPDGVRLFAANRRSGSLSVVDAKSGEVVFERGRRRGGSPTSPPCPMAGSWRSTPRGTRCSS